MNKINIKNILKYLHNSDYNTKLDKLREWYNNYKSDKLCLIIGSESSEEHIFVFLLKNLDKKFELISHVSKTIYPNIDKKIDFSELGIYKINSIDNIYFDYNVIKHFNNIRNDTELIFYNILMSLTTNGSLYIPFEASSINKLIKLSLFTKKLFALEHNKVKFEDTELNVYEIKLLVEGKLVDTFYQYSSIYELKAINNNIYTHKWDLFNSLASKYFKYFDDNKNIMELNFKAIILILELIIKRAILHKNELNLNITHEIIDNGLYRNKSESIVFNYNKYPYNVWFKITKV